jgi:uncharacterized protein YodC (DUF2158 family)
MQEFKIGDIVELKSGGPKMTVTGATTSDKEIGCKWFAGGKLNYEFFPPDSLEKVKEKEKEGKSSK